MDPIDRFNSGEFQSRHLGTTVIQEGDGSCEQAGRRWWSRRRAPAEHDWSCVPIAVDDINEAELHQSGIAFPMATFSDEFTCQRCKRIEVRNTRALL